MTAAPGAQPNFQTAKSSPRASEGKTPGLQAPRAPQAPTLKTSICTCAAPQPSPLLPPGARRGQGSAPRRAAALHREPGARRGSLPTLPAACERGGPPGSRGPGPRPTAPVPVVHVGPVLPLLHDPARVPLSPLGHGGAAAAENKGRPRRRGGSVADVSGRRTQEQSVRGAQKVPEIPAPCAKLPRPPRCGAPGESEPGPSRGAGARGGARGAAGGGRLGPGGRRAGGGRAEGGCGRRGERPRPGRPGCGAAAAVGGAVRAAALRRGAPGGQDSALEAGWGLRRLWGLPRDLRVQWLGRGNLRRLRKAGRLSPTHYYYRSVGRGGR